MLVFKIKIQILINLINNAVKYGTVKKPAIAISIKQTRSEWQIEVKDNGPGIPQDQQARIFEMFQTLGKVDRFGNKGTGIGLNTVKRLTELLNSKLNLESHPGKGCKFTLHIPRVRRS